MSERAKQKQTRQLKADNGLIYHIIFRQAGTLAKALLEGVMNSDDAGAQEIHVNLTTSEFNIHDNGKGFENSTEIEQFFETFGTPHDLDEHGVSRDAKFGTFRIGRGQLFAFAHTVWKSGEFEMDVDVKNRGLEYDLYEGVGPHEGCHIHGKLYSHLTPSEKLETEKALKMFVKYMSVPVYLNGEKVNTPPQEVEGWDEETDEYYLMTDGIPQGSGIEVYQQGVHVMHQSAWQFGIGAIVVTKVPVVLNTARNDILSSCKVWRAVKRRLKELGGKSIEKQAKRKLKLTDEERAAIFHALQAEEKRPFEVRDLKLFQDTTGTCWSAGQISRMASAHSKWDLLADGFFGVAFAKATDQKADRVLQRKMGLVLDLENIRMAGYETQEELMELIYSIYSGSLPKRVRLCTMSEITEGLSNDHRIIAPNKWSKNEKVIMTALGTINDYHRGVPGKLLELEEISRSEFPIRELRLGESDTADGWTDGETYIAINRELFKRKALSEKLVGDAVLLLIHEYCHAEPSNLNHGHSPEFYRRYHDLSRHAPNWTRKCLQKAVHGLRRRAKKLSTNISHDIRINAEAAYNAVMLEMDEEGETV